MKHCPRCSSTKQDHEFYVTGTKLSSYCKGCTRAYQQSWAKDNPDRKLEINRAWVARNRKRKKQGTDASNAVYRAIQKGLLVRPDACSACGSTGTIEAAHHDYEQPLNVRWLCQPCHREWDALNPKTKQP